MDVLTLGIFADKPTMSTRMAIVNSNLAHHLTRLNDDLRIIYFGRYGQEMGKDSEPFDCYEYVRYKGGEWQSSIIKKEIERYKIDIILSGDDWLTINGLIKAIKITKIPFYFFASIDSLPIPKNAYNIFKNCKRVFVPNQSYKYISNGVYFPYAVDWMTFKIVRPKLFNEFTFAWIGRNEPRKNINAAILAFEKVYKKYDCKLVLKSDWNMDYSKDVRNYIQNQKLPILMDAMIYSSPEKLASFYNSFHAYICSAKASEFEMEILEANACGLPTLVTDWTFMNENVKNEESGFLIPVESQNICPNGNVWGNISIPHLIKKMSWMLENQEKAMEMGIDGLLWVREKYNWKNVAEKLFDMIIDDQE